MFSLILWWGCPPHPNFQEADFMVFCILNPIPYHPNKNKIKNWLSSPPPGSSSTRFFFWPAPFSAAGAGIRQALEGRAQEMGNRPLSFVCFEFFGELVFLFFACFCVRLFSPRCLALRTLFLYLVFLVCCLFLVPPDVPPPRFHPQGSGWGLYPQLWKVAAWKEGEHRPFTWGCPPHPLLGRTDFMFFLSLVWG